jgi:hypothetical protein
MSGTVEEALLSDPNIAPLVNEKLNMAASALDESVAIVQEQCSNEEFVQYRNAVGKVLGEIFEIVRPLYSQHRSFAPPGYFEDPSDGT